MSVPERVRAVVEPVVAAQGLELFDLEQAGPVLRVTVDQAGGVDMSAIAATTRALSRALDEHDPIAGQYTLEVSSPGLERPLRTPAHWSWAVGRQVSVKTVPNHPAGRRFAGTVTAAGDDSVTLALDEPVGESITLSLDDIEKARTTFEWGPAPKPGGPKKKPASPSTPTSKKKVQP
jgi:ribosome maturation factor RimP